METSFLAMRPDKLLHQYNHPILRRWTARRPSGSLEYSRVDRHMGPSEPGKHDRTTAHPLRTHDLANLHRRLLRTRTLQHNSLRTFRLQPRLWTKPLSRPTAIPRNSAYPIRMIHQSEEEARRRSCYTPRTLFLGETSDLLATRVQLDLESLGILRPSLSGGDGV